MNLRGVLEPSDEGGYTAIMPALPCCISEGDTREEALENTKVAISFYLEPTDEEFQFSPKSEKIELTI